LPQVGQIGFGSFELFAGKLGEALRCFAAALGLASFLTEHLHFGFGSRHADTEQLHFAKEPLRGFPRLHR
jgi:hypothetical protein